MKAVYAVPATVALIYRAWSKKSLTPLGIVAATATAIVHALHPWNLPFVLLAVFFLAGTRVTHIKEDVKAHLTVKSKGTSGKEGPRTHVQVFANSLTASILILLHAHQLHQRQAALLRPDAKDAGTICYSWGGDLLVVGIIANYACVAADTFSSELGILARESPRLITSPTLRRVPRGTNGGVTPTGLAAGLLGSMIVVTASMLFLPFCTGDTAGRLGGGDAGSVWTGSRKRELMWFLTLWGVLGSLADSFLGAVFQRSVRDTRTGRIVEGEDGARVLVSPPPAAAGVSSSTRETHTARRAEIKAALLSGEGKHAVPRTQDESAVAEAEAEEEPEARAHRYDAHDKHRRASFGDGEPSRVVESGWDLLDNNDVNFLMAFTMSFGAMAVAGWYWGVPMQSIMSGIL